MAKKKKTNDDVSQREKYRRMAGTRALAVELPEALIKRLQAFCKRNNHVLRVEVERAIEDRLDEQEGKNAHS